MKTTEQLLIKYTKKQGFPKECAYWFKGCLGFEGYVLRYRVEYLGAKIRESMPKSMRWLWYKTMRK